MDSVFYRRYHVVVTGPVSSVIVIMTTVNVEFSFEKNKNKTQEDRIN